MTSDREECEALMKWACEIEQMDVHCADKTIDAVFSEALSGIDYRIDRAQGRISYGEGRVSFGQRSVTNKSFVFFCDQLKSLIASEEKDLHEIGRLTGLSVSLIDYETRTRDDLWKSYTCEETIELYQVLPKLQDIAPLEIILSGDNPVALENARQAINDDIAERLWRRFDFNQLVSLYDEIPELSEIVPLNTLLEKQKIPEEKTSQLKARVQQQIDSKTRGITICIRGLHPLNHFWLPQEQSLVFEPLPEGMYWSFAPDSERFRRTLERYSTATFK